MKKLVIFLWITAILVIGIVFIQNQAFFLAQQGLSINLIVHEIDFPPVPNGALLLLFFFSGALLSAASSLIGRFKVRKVIKNCKAAGDGYVDKIGELKTQIDQIKSRCTPKAAALKSSQVDTGAVGYRAPV